MNLKQFKLTNDDEIICEVVEGPTEESGEVVIRRVLKINTAEDYENNIRYYSFRPWMSFQDTANELSVLNIGHIIGETMPSNSLAIHYAAAMKEVEHARTNKKELNLDEIVNQMENMSLEEVEEFIEQKLREKEFQEKTSVSHVDSAQPNIIHFRPPKDTMH